MAGSTSQAAAGSVHSPIGGEVVTLDKVPDPVFASGMVGPGIAIAPQGDEEMEVVAPVSGKVIRIMPHAVVLMSDEGKGILVHVGIDTVGLKGEGFEILGVSKKDHVEVGQPLIRASVQRIREAGLDPICPVVLMDGKEGDVAVTATAGERVEAGAPIFDLL